uniref:FYVE-type domain-containing protein n=1 Tax=Globisporangium ultimum (strain ATCC 200006 / CBS 805.95 / DAOM BR144) TaxID=431595 RepID=K3WA19_GLOUD
MVAGNGGSSLFPLPSNFFPRLELAHEEARAFQDWGDRMLQETVDAYHRDQLDSREQKERKWKPLKQRGGLTAFRRRKAMGGDDEYRYMTTGVIEGTLDEVVRGRYADNTEDFRRVSAVYREDLVDCAVLHTIEKETETNPFYYAGFKWMTVQSPGKGLVKNRDVCWYEQMGLTHDRNGKEIGYTLTESVDLPNCPIFSDCVRAKLSVCYLYRRNKSGGVKVYMRGKNNAGGKVMEYIADQKSAELWLRVDAAMSVTHAAVATALVECSKGVRRMNFEKKKCEICEDRIGTIMSAAKECAMCHRYTCSRCIVKQRVLSPLVDFKAVCKENFCKKCLRFITQVNLREPQSVHDVWAFATSMSDSSQRSYHHHRIESERKLVLTDPQRRRLGDERRQRPLVPLDAAAAHDFDESNRVYPIIIQ